MNSAVIIVIVVVLLLIASLSYYSSRQSKDIRGCYNYLHEKFPNDFIAFANRHGSFMSKGCTVIAAVGPNLKIKELWSMPGKGMTDEMLQQKEYTGKKINRYILKNEPSVYGMPGKNASLIETTLSDAARAAVSHYQK
ncbi:MAG: hypothetical protein ACOYB8_10395 [Eubacteriaceae bacterium]|jgi:hypothetical protein